MDRSQKSSCTRSDVSLAASSPSVPCCAGAFALVVGPQPQLLVSAGAVHRAAPPAFRRCSVGVPSQSRQMGVGMIAKCTKVETGEPRSSGSSRSRNWTAKLRSMFSSRSCT
eukprot:scaffold27689_cov100-Isochrysis_galbana.AAC.5